MKEKPKPVLVPQGSSMNLTAEKTIMRKASTMNLSPQPVVSQSMSKTPAVSKLGIKVVNDDLGTFLTGVKEMGGLAAKSRLSPEVNKSSRNVFNANKSVDVAHSQSPMSGNGDRTGRGSPGSQSMMMSFNFITSVPIGEFI